MTRRLENWIDGFVEYSSVFPSPELFRKWGAISCLSATLERKIWLRSIGKNTYPNTFIFILGESASGKSVVTSEVEKFWRDLKDLHIGVSSLTKASLVDMLAKAERKIISPGSIEKTLEFNSLQVVSNEFGVLMSKYDGEFMAGLTDIYDCGYYGERKRAAGTKIDIPNSQISLLCATTPAQFNEFLPEGAWEQGFISRCMLIFTGESRKTSLFDVPTGNVELRKKLMNDLREIFQLIGEWKFSPEAREAIEAWHKADYPPQPHNPKLRGYNRRRLLHVLKLCLVFAAAEKSDPVITLENYQSALGALLEAEANLPDLFKNLTASPDSKIIDELWYAVYQEYMRKAQKPIPETLVFNWLQERVATYRTQSFVDVMVKSGLFQQIFVHGKGQFVVPKEYPKHRHL